MSQGMTSQDWVEITAQLLEGGIATTGNDSTREP